MHILDLPPELFHLILLFSILARSLIPDYDEAVDARRALRLKLVSKAFRHAFQPALFESRVLDRFTTRHSFRTPRRHYGADQLWHSYLVYRVHNETDPAIGRFVEIQQIAKKICIVARSDYDEIVDGLCWIALARGTKCPAHRKYWAEHIARENEPPNPRLNLLSAAAYFGHLDLAKELLNEGCCPTKDDLFLSPMLLAAFAGNRDVLMLFQEHLPDYEDRSSGRRTTRWRGKTNPTSIKGAVLSGDIDMVRLAIFPPSRAEPQRPSFNGQEFGNVDPCSNSGYELFNAIWMSTNWDVFQYLEGGLSPSPDRRDGYLALHAERGNLGMVEKLLDHGWDIEGGNKLNNYPLIQAARGFHLDVVDTLLRRGANPNNHEWSQLGSALSAAATAGSMSIIRKLYEYGANNDDDPSDQMKMLRKALLLEHTEMVNFFFERGLLGRQCPESIRKNVEEEGLESMMQLLEKWEWVEVV
ncbi:hypothetical protein ANO14919_080570 [Xylariales sp. No.14919]|nr:hypothetical protein ANO14919_080570 [Xylariales sp. No.14919]